MSRMLLPPLDIHSRPRSSIDSAPNSASYNALGFDLPADDLANLFRGLKATRSLLAF